MTNHFPFFQWKKYRKISLFAGILILLIALFVTLSNWVLDVRGLNNSLSKLSASARQEIIYADAAPSVLATLWKNTLTFTHMSNYALGIIWILFALYPTKWHSQRAAYLITVYITITFLVYWGLIFPQIFKGGIGSFKTFLTTLVHAINPIIGFSLITYNRKRITISKGTFFGLIPIMVIYYGFALVSFLIGQNTADNFAGLKKSPDSDVLINHQNGQKLVDNVIYEFLNILHPFFYQGDNLAIVVAINFGLVVGGILFTLLLGFIWKVSLRLKWDRENKAHLVY